MKSNLFCLSMGMIFALTSCGSLGTATGTASSTASSGNSMLSGLLNELAGSVIGTPTPITQADLVGSWQYSKPDCKFESADLLKKAGGEVVATEVESKLIDAFTKIGISSQAMSISFDNASSASFALAGKSLPVSYTFDAKTNTVVFVDQVLGLVNLTATVQKVSSNKIALLFDGQKLLSLLAMAGNMTNNTTIQSVSKLLSSYEGMKIGMELTK